MSITTIPITKERPILFSGPMVRAILEGRKSQTRRIIKPQPPADHPFPQNSEGDFVWNDRDADVEDLSFWPSYEKGLRCPYGQPGDRLWVRERCWINDGDIGAGRVLYHVTDPDLKHKWRPSIHMPRWASRITLEVTGVRVERVQDISVEDCIAEGINRISHGREGYYYHYARTTQHPRNFVDADFAYEELWQSIHGPGSWDANPWVWVIEFRKLEAIAS